LIYSREYIFGLFDQAKTVVFEFINTHFGTQLQ
jgi:hypothetical protein